MGVDIGSLTRARLSFFTISPPVFFSRARDENPKTIGIKLDRALKRLQRDGKIVKNSKGHKKTYYQLSDLGKNVVKDFKEDTSLIYDVTPLFLGTFDPWKKYSYEEFSSKILNRIIQEAKEHLPDIWDEYQEEYKKRQKT